MVGNVGNSVALIRSQPLGHRIALNTQSGNRLIKTRRGAKPRAYQSLWLPTLRYFVAPQVEHLYPVVTVSS